MTVIDIEIAHYCCGAGYTPEQIAKGLAAADAQRAVGIHERLSVTLSHILDSYRGPTESEWPASHGM